MEGKRAANGRVFIGGIVQGSIREVAIHDQDYRDAIAAVVAHLSRRRSL